VLFEPEGAVHLFAENLSSTEPAKIMLISVADEDAKRERDPHERTNHKNGLHRSIDHDQIK
jgi:hypothetical protein